MTIVAQDEIGTGDVHDGVQPQPYLALSEFLSGIRPAVLILIALVCSTFPRIAFCTGITVSNIALGSPDIANGNVPITFNLSWDHSWRTSSGTTNWDAAWVFVKYRVGSGAWTHARLNNTGNSGPTSATVSVGLADPSSSFNISTNPGVGVFVYRSADGTGTFSPSGVSVSWNYGADSVNITSSVEVQVFAIEMVYVRESAFYAGDNATSSAALKQGSSDTDPWRIGAEDALSVTNSAGNTSGSGTNASIYYYPGTGDGSGDSAGSAFTLAASYPKGFGGFYLMKGEISQGQWVTFFNTLTNTQKSARDITGSSNGGKNTDSLSNRNNVSWSSGDATLPDQGSGATYEHVGMNYLSWADVAAYLDWAGLRPTTELEFEKAGRGQSSAVSGEYSWGSTNITQATSISDAGLSGERGGSGTNITYGNDSNVQGPTRVGSFGAGASTREGAGAGFFGVMDLSGNVWERVVSLGSSSGRSFDGNLHGDGVLDASGDANVTNWPGTTAAGVGLRGGSWDVASSYTRLSDRYYGATTVATRDSTRGGRGARSEPIETDPHWSNVVLLVRGDGTDGGTTIVDSSSSAKTVNVYGNTQTSASNFKIGNAALAFDGVGDYIDLADSNDWDFGTSDFTVEFWYRPTSNPSNAEIFGQRTGSGYGPLIISRASSGTLSVYASSTNINWLGASALLASSTTLSLNTWYHIAVTRRDGIFFLFVDGVPHDSNGSYPTTALMSSTNNLRIGGGTSLYTYGQLDELRITKGVDRYSSYFSFTEPTQAFDDTDPEWSNVKLLMHMEASPIVDSSATPLATISTGGGNPISTSYSKFGSKSAGFITNNTNIVLTNDGRFDVGSSDWTWEGWVQGNFIAAGRTLMGTSFMRVSTNTLAVTFQLSFNASTYPNIVSRTLPAANTFYHIRVQRKGSWFRFYESGKMIGTYYNATANTGSTNPTMGGAAGGSNYSGGYVDEVRYTLGVARDYVANFPVQIKRFPAQ